MRIENTNLGRFAVAFSVSLISLKPAPRLPVLMAGANFSLF